MTRNLWPMASMLAATLGLLCAANAFSQVADKDVEAAIDKLADAIKKGDANAVKKLAANANGMKQIDDNADLMQLFKSLKLDKQVGQFAKNVNAKQAADPANEEAAHRIMAMAEIIKVRGWPVNMAAGGKTPKAWQDHAGKTADAAAAFKKAVATKDAKSIKIAAEKLNTACINCHAVFK